MLDRLSDMLARINNGQQRGRLVIEVVRTRHCEEVLECLWKEGFIRSFVVNERSIEVHLKYKNGEPLVKKIKRISRPGFRCYYSAEKLREEFLKNNLIIFTSSQGVMLNSSLILSKKHVGGEPLFMIK